MSIVLSKETTTNESSRKRQLKDMINSCGKVVKYLTFTSKNNWMPMVFLPILMHFRPCLSAKISYRGSPFRNFSLSTTPGTEWIPQYSTIFCPFFAKNTFSTNPRLVWFCNNTIPWKHKICTIRGPSVIPTFYLRSC